MDPLKHLKEKLVAAKEAISGPPIVKDAILGETVFLEVRERLEQCRSADEVFSSFAIDAAKVLVSIMTTSHSAADRQRAAVCLLDRAIGRPVDRMMSVTMEVANSSDEELDSRINDLLLELGYVTQTSNNSFLIQEASNDEIKKKETKKVD